MSDVHRTPLPLRIQLPRRSFDSRGTDRGVREPGNASDGITRSRWSVRFAALSSRRKKGQDQGAYRGRGDVFPWGPSSASGRFARWISKSLPPDYENEIARWAKRRSLRLEFRFH